jgi:uncharacterized tellurite resistance protein B-like protein
MLRRRVGPSHEGFLERRRARQRGGGTRGGYTFALAALHVELLAAMADADGQLRSIEVEEVLAFIDRATLGRGELDRLEQCARMALRSPPSLDVLCDQLATMAGRPAIARQVVEDLARVAAADARTDPCEVELLARVCDTLQLPRIELPADDELGVVDASRPRRLRELAPRVIAERRARNAVRRTLDVSGELRGETAS